MSQTEQASPRRLREARRRGDSPRSALLVGAGGLVVFLLLAPAWLSALLTQFQERLEKVLARDAPAIPVAELAVAALSDVLWLTLPLTLAVAASALVIGFLQARGQLRLASTSTHEEREWLRNPFSREKLSSLAASWLALATLAGLGSLMGGRALREMVGSLGNVRGALQALATTAGTLGWAAVGLLTAIGLLAFALQHAFWLQRLRMSRSERLQEQRETEGDLGVRRYRERLQRGAEPALTAALLEQSTLVIHSTSVAVLIRHKRPAEAPVVLLKVRGQAAVRAIGLAQAVGVPVVCEPQVAEGLSRLPTGALAQVDNFPGLQALLEM